MAIEDFLVPSGMTELLRPVSYLCVSIIRSRICHPSQKTGLGFNLPQAPLSPASPQSSEGHETLNAFLLLTWPPCSRGEAMACRTPEELGEETPDTSYLCESWILLGKTRASQRVRMKKRVIHEKYKRKCWAEIQETCLKNFTSRSRHLTNTIVFNLSGWAEMTVSLPVLSGRSVRNQSSVASQLLQLCHLGAVRQDVSLFEMHMLFDADGWLGKYPEKVIKLSKVCVQRASDFADNKDTLG